MGYDFLIVSCMYNTQYVETKKTEFINSMYEPLKKMDVYIRRNPKIPFERVYG